MGTKFHLFKNEVNKVMKKNEIWSQNSIHFEGMKKKRDWIWSQNSIYSSGKWKKRMEFGRKILFKNLTKSTYFLCFPKLTTDRRTDGQTQ